MERRIAVLERYCGRSGKRVCDRVDREQERGRKREKGR
jgi:hypothetical protein